MAVTFVPEQHCFRAPVMDLIPNGERHSHTPLLSTSSQPGTLRALAHCLMAMEEEPSGSKLLSMHLQDNPGDSEMLKKHILGD